MKSASAAADSHSFVRRLAAKSDAVLLSAAAFFSGGSFKNLIRQSSA
jgi:hypothetical protein